MNYSGTADDYVKENYISGIDEIKKAIQNVCEPIYQRTSSYLEKLKELKKDFTGIADKHMEKKFLPDGLFGYTWLNDVKMVINESISSYQSFKTQVHEAIHTEWEYQTRVLTEWMVSIKQEVKKYFKQKKEYF